MNRRSALATAAAATMTLLSGFVVVGAHTGALGLGGTPTPAVAQPAAAPIAAPAAATPAAPDTARTVTATATRATPAGSQTQAREQHYEGRESDD